MIFIKKILFLFSFFFLFLSCGKEDLACNILTGGVCAIASGVSNLKDPCKLGLSSCNNGNVVPSIKEVNTTVYVNPDDLNTTPSLSILGNRNIILNVGEQINLFLAVSDQDLDEVNISAIMERPTVASVIVLDTPDRLLITALASGSTFVQAYGKDDDNHVGQSHRVNITVVGGDANKTTPQNNSVTFTKDKIVMNTGDVKRIGFTVRGLQPDYTVEVSLASLGSNLVDVNISTSATSIDIYSNANHGVTVASFTFTDSTGITLTKDLPIEVTNTTTTPPGDPNLTNYTVRDSEACKNTNIWKKLINSYSLADREIDDLNSITFQSLATATTNITLYYKDVVDTIQTRPDDAMDIKVDDVPRLDGTRETNRGFIIQTSKGFFDSGFYYVKIEQDCYRGEFPKSDAVKNFDIYKNVKLVVN